MLTRVEIKIQIRVRTCTTRIECLDYVKIIRFTFALIYLCLGKLLVSRIRT